MTGLGAREITVPGVAAGFPGARSVALSDLDRQIAGLPNLKHFVDPAGMLLRNEVYRDRKSGAPVYYTSSVVSHLADGGASWGNQPVLQFASKAGALWLHSPRSAAAVATIPASFTALVVASFDDALDATGAAPGALSTILGTYGPQTSASGVSMQYGWVKPNAGDTVGMGIQFYSRFDGVLNNTTASASGFNTGANVPRIWMFSYDATNNTSKLYSHTNSVLPVVTKSDHAADAWPADFWIFMNAFVSSSTSGTKGRLGRALIFDTPLDRAGGGGEATFVLARSLLAQTYGIA